MLAIILCMFLFTVHASTFKNEEKTFQTRLQTDKPSSVPSSLISHLRENSPSVSKPSKAAFLPPPLTLTGQVTAQSRSTVSVQNAQLSPKAPVLLPSSQPKPAPSIDEYFKDLNSGKSVVLVSSSFGLDARGNQTSRRNSLTLHLSKSRRGSIRSENIPGVPRAPPLSPGSSSPQDIEDEDLEEKVGSPVLPPSSPSMKSEEEAETEAQFCSGCFACFNSRSSTIKVESKEELTPAAEEFIHSLIVNSDDLLHEINPKEMENAHPQAGTSSASSSLITDPSKHSVPSRIWQSSTRNADSDDDEESSTSTGLKDLFGGKSRENSPHLKPSRLASPSTSFASKPSISFTPSKKRISEVSGKGFDATKTKEEYPLTVKGGVQVLATIAPKEFTQMLSKTGEYDSDEDDFDDEGRPKPVITSSSPLETFLGSVSGSSLSASSAGSFVSLPSSTPSTMSLHSYLSSGSVLTSSSSSLQPSISQVKQLSDKQLPTATSFLDQSFVVSPTTNNLLKTVPSSNRLSSQSLTASSSLLPSKTVRQRSTGIELKKTFDRHKHDIQIDIATQPRTFLYMNPFEDSAYQRALWEAFEKYKADYMSAAMDFLKSAHSKYFQNYKEDCEAKGINVSDDGKLAFHPPPFVLHSTLEKFPGLTAIRMSASVDMYLLHVKAPYTKYNQNAQLFVFKPIKKGSLRRRLTNSDNSSSSGEEKSSEDRSKAAAAKLTYFFAQKDCVVGHVYVTASKDLIKKNTLLMETLVIDPKTIQGEFLKTLHLQQMREAKAQLEKQEARKRSEEEEQKMISEGVCPNKEYLLREIQRLDKEFKKDKNKNLSVYKDLRVFHALQSKYSNVKYEKAKAEKFGRAEFDAKNPIKPFSLADPAQLLVKIKASDGNHYVYGLDDFIIGNVFINDGQEVTIKQQYLWEYYYLRNANAIAFQGGTTVDGRPETPEDDDDPEDVERDDSFVKPKRRQGFIASASSLGQTHPGSLLRVMTMTNFNQSPASQVSNDLRDNGLIDQKGPSKIEGGPKREHAPISKEQKYEEDHFERKDSIELSRKITFAKKLPKVWHKKALPEPPGVVSQEERHSDSRNSSSNPETDENEVVGSKTFFIDTSTSGRQKKLAGKGPEDTLSKPRAFSFPTPDKVAFVASPRAGESPKTPWNITEGSLSRPRLYSGNSVPRKLSTPVESTEKTKVLLSLLTAEEHNPQPTSVNFSIDEENVSFRESTKLTRPTSLSAPPSRSPSIKLKPGEDLLSAAKPQTTTS